MKYDNSGSNTKGDLKSGLTEKTKITQKTTRGETKKGQRPVPKKEACGRFTFKG